MSKLRTNRALESSVKSNRGTLSFTHTPEVDAFSAVTLINDQVILNALDVVVESMQSGTLWGKSTHIYPISGRTDIAHRYNLKNVAVNVLQYINSPTHDSNGVDYGPTSYAKTGFVFPSVSGHMGVYIRDNVLNTNWYDIGSTVDSVTFTILNTGRTLLNSLFCAIRSLRTSIGIGSISDSRGFSMITKNTSGTAIIGYKNGIAIDTQNPTAGTAPSVELYLGGSNNNGTLAFSSERQAAFYTFGDHLNAAEVLEYYNIIQTFQTTLSRQV